VNVGALAHLQLGRAYVMAGDTAKARAVHEDFLTLWKDADPDIPILIVTQLPLRVTDVTENRVPDHVGARPHDYTQDPSEGQ
jgi:hypothetical protein